MKNYKIVAVIVVVIFIPALCGCSRDAGEEAVIFCNEEKESIASRGETEKKICVYIIGEVINPGVYMLEEGARVYNVVEAAGGLTENAAEKCINMAAALSDGEQIIVYSREEAESIGSVGTNPSSLVVNINTADKEMLMTLPGIGEARASDIIKYREKNGAFQKIEDIMKVPGIKDAAFQKIEDLITVN